MATVAHQADFWSSPYRIFSTRKWYGYYVAPANVEVWEADLVFARCTCSKLCHCLDSVDTTELPMVIASDGGCRQQDRPHAVAAIGVYVGDNSPFNVSQILPEKGKRATSEVAELTAALRALQTRMAMKDKGCVVGSRTLILKTDYQSLIDIFREADFYRRRRTYADDLYWLIAEAMAKLETDYGIRTLLWWVPRQFNRDADHLASAALRADAINRQALVEEYDRRLEEIKRRRAREMELLEHDNRKRAAGLLEDPMIIKGSADAPIVIDDDEDNEHPAKKPCWSLARKRTRSSAPRPAKYTEAADRLSTRLRSQIGAANAEQVKPQTIDPLSTPQPAESAVAYDGPSTRTRSRLAAAKKPTRPQAFPPPPSAPVFAPSLQPINRSAAGPAMPFTAPAMPTAAPAVPTVAPALPPAPQLPAMPPNAALPPLPQLRVPQVPSALQPVDHPVFSTAHLFASGVLAPVVSATAAANQAIESFTNELMEWPARAQAAMEASSRAWQQTFRSYQEEVQRWQASVQEIVRNWQT